MFCLLYIAELRELLHSSQRDRIHIDHVELEVRKVLIGNPFVVLEDGQFEFDDL